MNTSRSTFTWPAEDAAWRARYRVWSLAWKNLSEMLLGSIVMGAQYRNGRGLRVGYPDFVGFGGLVGGCLCGKVKFGDRWSGMIRLV
jgi:hypothetical protein